MRSHVRLIVARWLHGPRRASLAWALARLCACGRARASANKSRVELRTAGAACAIVQIESIRLLMFRTRQLVTHTRISICTIHSVWLAHRPVRMSLRLCPTQPSPLPYARASHEPTPQLAVRRGRHAAAAAARSVVRSAACPSEITKPNAQKLRARASTDLRFILTRAFFHLQPATASKNAIWTGEGTGTGRRQRSPVCLHRSSSR